MLSKEMLIGWNFFGLGEFLDEVYDYYSRFTTFERCFDMINVR